MNKTYILSGGGTGGHIFPALSIADEIMRRQPNATVHFIGALGRMEMDRVPKAGYPITGLHVSGFNRNKPWTFPKTVLQLLLSLWEVRRVLRKLQPDAVIGTGGFASGPALKMAQSMGIPTLVQEQNSFAGITNKSLAKKAHYVCTAYENAASFFPAEKVILTGNPVREKFTKALPTTLEAQKNLGFSGQRPVLLVLGGSLGARAINQQIADSLPALMESGWDVFWQCGKAYEEQYRSLETDRVKVRAFIADMEVAYGAATCIISRAGAGTLSELCLVGKPAILIPSPNVAEDHQTHNARALSEKEAAVLLPEKELEKLVTLLNELLYDEERRLTLSKNILALALPRATSDIVDLIEKLPHA